MNHFTLGVCWDARVCKELPVTYSVCGGDSPVSAHLQCMIPKLRGVAQKPLRTTLQVPPTPLPLGFVEALLGPSGAAMATGGK